MRPQDAFKTALTRLLLRLGVQKHCKTNGFSRFFAAHHNASETLRRRPKAPPGPLQEKKKAVLGASWGHLGAPSGVLGRLGSVLGAFWGPSGHQFLVIFRSFSGYHSGTPFWSHFGPHFEPFWGRFWVHFLFILGSSFSFLDKFSRACVRACVRACMRASTDATSWGWPVVSVGGASWPPLRISKLSKGPLGLL